MNYASLKAAGYVLIHTPDMIEHNGTTQTTERIVNPNSDYLKDFSSKLRSFDEVVNDPANQTYIGNITPQALKEIPLPWYEHPVQGTKEGKLGEIVNEIEFYGLIAASDVFDLVKLETSFAPKVKEALENNPLYAEYASKINEGIDKDQVMHFINDEDGEGLYYNGEIVGVVVKAHDIDVSLTSHIILENLVGKASGVAALKNMLVKNNIDAKDIDFVIECSEEACGDMNQRGGGNFAKAIAEMAGAVNATGADVRGFCAAPTHALVMAASLVAAGTYKNVAIVAGGSTAKLGQNGKTNVDKGLKIQDDVIGGFAALVTENDGVHPILRTDAIGKHNVSSGSSPQIVAQVLVSDPLDKAGLTINDIDVYSSEMHNTTAANAGGIGDIAMQSIKMIGAVGVAVRKEIEKPEMKKWVDEKYVPGFAPVQGHIPSGVPYLGFAVDQLTNGDLNRVMIIGKGSLFLGRMTNLFDGISVIVERNSGEVASDETSVELKDEVKKTIAQALRDFASQMNV